MVASGGCTAAALAASGSVADLHIVDPNPAQVALARLKLALVAGSSPEERLALMGHAALPPGERAEELRRRLQALGLDEGSLGPVDEIAALGPDHAGRYERLFAALRDELAARAAEVAAILALDDPDEQASRLRTTGLDSAIVAALENVMALPNLVAFFGEDATRNPRAPFATHFAARVRWVLETQPASSNPFLWQLLTGRFPAGVSHAWLAAPRPRAMPRLAWTVGTMDEALEGRRGDCDYVHLSNILDWLSPEAARHTLGLAWRALASGGWVLVRQLNSVLEIPALDPRFAWQRETAERFLRGDRSFFYRSLHLGRKP